MKDDEAGVYVQVIVFFIGLFLFFCYAFGMWYFNRDYLEQTRQDLVQIYLELPSPAEPTEQYYGVKTRKWFTYYVVGNRKYENLSEKDVIDFYKEYLPTKRWEIDKIKVDRDRGNNIHRISAKNGEFFLSISSIENTGKWRYSLIKKDWIYEAGF